MALETVELPRPGVLFRLDGKLLAICPRCMTLIRIDKPLFGSIHFCKPDEPAKK